MLINPPKRNFSLFEMIMTQILHPKILTSLQERQKKSKDWEKSGKGGKVEVRFWVKKRLIREDPES